MKLFLAVAVLMMAFVAYTEAQEDTMEDKFSRFGEKMSELGQTMAEKARSTFETIHNSEAAVKTRGWFEERMQQIKDSFQ
ncbi:apolipoprotein C-I [Platichthys flesus]|uniref:apolipoprotein C-I n=1 Tax=Platichthys flesus TaxID=8260 RepID=UPI002DB65596|nr:apolipoprotein C-I [Platichthys flesus]